MFLQNELFRLLFAVKEAINEIETLLMEFECEASGSGLSDVRLK